MSIYRYADPTWAKSQGMQVVDLTKLPEKDPSYAEVMETAWQYQKEGFEKNIEDILNKNSKLDKPYYIAWLFKPSQEHKRLLQSTFYTISIPIPPTLCFTLLKVDNKSGRVDVEWSLPYDAPQMDVRKEVVDSPSFRPHPKIVQSVEKIKKSYIYTNPIQNA